MTNPAQALMDTFSVFHASNIFIALLRGQMEETEDLLYTLTDDRLVELINTAALLATMGRIAYDDRDLEWGGQ